MPERDELDRLIDSELARYAEPRVGLEQRIVAHIAAQGSNRSSFLRMWQRWALGGSVTAAIVLTFGIRLVTHHETSVNTAGVARPSRQFKATATVPDTQAQPAHSKQSPKRVQNITRRPKPFEVAPRRQYPKLDIFPAPQPLSEQEQALVVIATAKSDSARENLLDSQRHLNAPLQISAIDIPPLTKSEDGTK